MANNNIYENYMDLIASFSSPSFVIIHIKRVGRPYGLKIKAKTAVIIPVRKSQKLPGLLKGQPKKYSRKQRIAPIARKKEPILSCQAPIFWSQKTYYITALPSKMHPRLCLIL